MKIFFLMAALVMLAGCKSKQDNPQEPSVDAGTTAQAVIPASADEVVDKKDAEPDGAKAPKPEGKMENGLRQGQWRFFHANGKKAAEGVYKDGLKNGQWSFWYDSGKKTAEGAFHMGKKVGKWIDYDEQGNKVSEQFYADGVRVYK